MGGPPQHPLSLTAQGRKEWEEGLEGQEAVKPSDSQGAEGGQAPLELWPVSEGRTVGTSPRGPLRNPGAPLLSMFPIPPPMQVAGGPSQA